MTQMTAEERVQSKTTHIHNQKYVILSFIARTFKTTLKNHSSLHEHHNLWEQ